MQSFNFTIKDPLGLHARPAGLLANKAAAFSSNITIKCNGKEVDAKKLIRLLTLGIKQGDALELEIEGIDEELAKADLEKFFVENL